MGALEMPVVSKRAATVLRIHAPRDFESIPAVVDGVQGEYDAINLNKIVKCLDETRASFEVRPPGDKVRPDKAGFYRHVFRIVIDRSKVGDIALFRLGGWNSQLSPIRKLEMHL
ncbi:MAG TPA: hypothetical protein VK699_17405 [Terriglobales bacterium]|nr:hypothetical protein [Terriglobales bacterium]